jgi:hypothetical protein
VIHYFESPKAQEGLLKQELETLREVFKEVKSLILTFGQQDSHIENVSSELANL